MSQSLVIDFAVETPQPAPPPELRRIRLVSRALEWLFLVLSVGTGLIAAALITAFIIPYMGDHFAMGPPGGLVRWAPHLAHEPPLPPHFVAVSDMPLVQRLAHVPVGLLHAAPMVLLFWSLRRLFGLYAKGVVFSRDNARTLKRVGAALIVIALAPWLGHTFLDSLHLAVDKAWMHGSSIQELVLGAIVYVIAQVMQLGHELEEERSQFV
ncbi:MAG: DUF2975 domain-containing protein [Caulobacteraceae bacterium]